MSRSTRELRGPDQDRYFRDVLGDEDVGAEAAQRILRRLRREVARVHVWRAAVKPATRRVVAGPASAASSPQPTLTAPPRLSLSDPPPQGARENPAGVASVSPPPRGEGPGVGGAPQSPPVAVAPPPQPSPTRGEGVAAAPASASFDPYAFSVVSLLRREGREALLAKLIGIASAEHLRQLAEAQQIGLEPRLRGPDATLDELRVAIAAGAQRRIADREAAAG